MIKNISVLIPTLKSKELTLTFIKSFEKFKPIDLKVEYIIVENSDDMSYMNYIDKMVNDLVWINNSCKVNNSYANAQAIEVGKYKISNELVFIGHNDICITNKSFFESSFKKIEEGYDLVGYRFDTNPKRIGALHSSGMILKSDIVKKENCFPTTPDANGNWMDVTDIYTKHCRDNNKKYFCFKTTINFPEIEETLEDKYRNAHHLDRCIDENNKVIFLHLGRGDLKNRGNYFKPNRMGLSEWVSFCSSIIS